MPHSQVAPRPRRKISKIKQGHVIAPAPATVIDRDTMFQRAIEIMSVSFDAKKIAIALAKEHPEIFVKLYEATTIVLGWHREVITAIYQNNFVQAIKTIRENTGVGLKEAKDIADNLRVYMSNNGYMLSAHSSIPTKLLEAHALLYKELCVAAMNLK
jgi:ribosomal protein L7/L12